MRTKPQKPTIPRVCEICGADFLTYTQSIKRGGGRFCSRQCAGKARTTGQTTISWPADQAQWCAGVPHDRTTGSGPVFEMRQKTGLTQKDFARAVGLSKSLIEKCEKAGKLPASHQAEIKLKDQEEK